ncbi:unnamed protein product [Mortierella alpina]
MSSPSFLSSISETARGLFGRFSSSLRARPSNALLNSSTSSLPLAPPAPNLHSRFSKSSVSLSNESVGTRPTEFGQHAVKTASSVADIDAERALGMPDRKRFESGGFSFQFKNRNSSTSSLLSSAGGSLRLVRASSRRSDNNNSNTSNRSVTNNSSHRKRSFNDVLSVGVAHGSSSGKLLAKKRPAFRRHHTDTPCASTKQVPPPPPAFKSTPEWHAHDNHASRNVIPKTVTIRHLPEYVPDASFGHNAKRNERYARIRLAALRDHQLTLVKLLSDLLDTESRFRQQHEHVEQAAVGVVNRHTGGRAQSKAPNLRSLNTPPVMCRHYKREAAAQEYQKALLDLWQADNSLCHWLTRYIRTARRVSRNLDLMLLDSSAARALGSPVSLDKTKNNAVVVLVARPSGVMPAVVHPASQYSSTFDLVSTTLPHVDEVSRFKGQTLKHADAHDGDDDKSLQTPNPVRRCSPRVSHRSAAAPSAQSLLRLPSQAPTAPPPPVPAPQPPRDFMISPLPPSAPGVRSAQLLVAQVHAPSHGRDRSRGGLGFQSSSSPSSSCRGAIVGGNRMEEKRFGDYDELEATVFVGRHMQSLQKANEFLSRFDREAGHSTIALERFENAREVYRRRVHRG